jgi:hypothetical protein
MPGPRNQVTGRNFSRHYRDDRDANAKDNRPDG